MFKSNKVLVRMGNYPQALKFSNALDKKCVWGETYSIDTDIVVELSSETYIQLVCDKCHKEFTLMAKSIRSRKDGNSLCTSCSLSKHTTELNIKFGEEWGNKQSKTKKSNVKYRNISINNLPKAGTQRGSNSPRWVEKDDKWQQRMGEYGAYSYAVNTVTRHQSIETLKNIDKRGRCDTTNDTNYQLDHKVSVSFGFKNDISPEIMGNIHNLEMIPWKENCKKRAKCSMTLGELLCKIEIGCV